MATIPIDKILPNPEQPRLEMDPTGLQALADSIRQHGLINPIAVEEAGEHYILIDGERRWRAAMIAGLSEIKADVRPAMNGGGEQERLTLALVANIQRRDMNPVEEGIAFRNLREQGYSASEISRMVGLAESNVYNRLRLLELEPEIQELFANHQLPLHSQVISAIQKIPDEKRVRIARSFAQKNTRMATIISSSKRLAAEGMERRHYSPPVPAQGQKWDAVAQLGHEVKEPYLGAAQATCKACPLYDSASPSICRDCPAVDLLRRLTS